MNCKPGDLAYIKRPGPHYGKTVRVLELDPETPRDPHWLYEGDIECMTLGCRYTSLRDDILRPIGGPAILSDKRHAHEVCA